ncbi:putative mitochondrial frataxin-like protein [Leptomonas pyrrhocoris]|uniref:ferroxidase n=1 Tax=Leptomonas pyrrhocoris TaxID=157538 RepID=A0A0M9G087_LEPPY|nr:putative mitochondrial frataxin-like protein [Leptomonas pyrrhocoris]KPA79549.1 putative mitochondrial frataxin-like protein [Leptomonas pyrrhocoris]|eukprot:XP_015657988.1 putative mitochondrial frataxin-like protein [Leptomonas pyrrhocoris]
MRRSLLLRSTVARNAAAATGLVHLSTANHFRQPLACAVAVPFSSHHGSSLHTAIRLASTTTTTTHGTSKPKIVHYSKLGMDGFTDVKYNTAADEFLENLEAKLDAIDSAELEDISCNSGVLTIETSSKGTFIINKQAPNVQLWLSSPISGPHHYDMVTSTSNGVETVYWKSDNDAHDLREKLEVELSEVLQHPFQL